MTKSVAKCGIVMFAMMIISTIAWQVFIPGRLYDCSDDNMAGFLRPGDWIHHPVSVPHIVLSKTMSEPDTIKAGWSVAGLWGLWFSFVGASLVVSIALARVQWIPRRRQEQAYEHTHAA
jgi:hypothetical protein